MRALMKIGKGEGGIELRDIAEPEPKDDEIKIRVHAAGICGTDLHIMKDEYDVTPPMVMGHEYAGTVVSLGKNAAGFSVGDRAVSLTTVRTCGVCPACESGQFMHCETRKAIGTHVDGAFAQYIVVPAGKALKVPANVALDEAALCEPLACVVRCVVEMSTAKAGDYAYVSGPGAIGLLALQVAKASGAVVAVGGTAADAERLKLAEKLGAAATIRVDLEGAEARMKDFTGGAGFDVAYECSGVAASTDSCVRALKRMGSYVQIGLYGKKIPYDFDLALKKELSIHTGFTAAKTTWRRALRLLEHGLVDLSPLISAKLPLADWEKGFDSLIRKEGLKVLLVP